MTEIEESLRLAKEICVATKISMTQHTTQQVMGIRKDKSVAAKEFCRFLKFKTKFAAEDFGQVNFKN